MVQDLILQNKIAEGSLLGYSVTSKHFYALNPSFLEDYSLRDEIFKQFPLIKALLKHNYPLKGLYSLLKCGSFTGSGVKISCACGSFERPFIHHCSNRSCPNCSKIRSKRIKRRLLPHLLRFKKDSLNSVRFLTISPKNYDSLQVGYKHLTSSLIKLFRSKYFKERLKGGFYVIESKNTGKGWNIHAHILYYGRFLNNRLYGFCQNCNKKVWIKKDKLNGSFYCSNRSCNSIFVSWDKKNSRLVSKVEKVFKCPVNIDIKEFRTSFYALNYCLKYVSVNKDDFSSLDDFANYISFTRSKRLINVFGSLYDSEVSSLPCVCFVCRQKYVFEFILDFDLKIKSLLLENSPQAI